MFRVVRRRSRSISASCRMQKGAALTSLLLLNNNIIILGKYLFCYILFSLSLSNFVRLLNPITYLHFETTVVIVLFPHNETKFNYLKQTFLSTNDCFKNKYEIVPNLLIGSLFLYLFKALQPSHEEFGIGIKNRDLILLESGSDFPTIGI